MRPGTSVVSEVKRIAADNAAKTLIEATLRETGAVCAAARALRMERSNLRREMRRLGLR